MERNVRTFDLTNPLQAFQYATFLIRLREQDDLLKELFQKRRGELGEWIKRRWTKTSQHDELKPV
jgi:hypothetical protein